MKRTDEQIAKSKWLKASEAARLYPISESMLYLLRDKCLVTTARIGTGSKGAIMFDHDSLRRYIDAHTTTAIGERRLKLAR